MKVSPAPFRVAACLVALALLIAPAAARSQSAPASLAVLVDEVTSLFPTIEADVIEVRGDVLTLSVGRRDGVRPGVELILYRQGRELRHPRTGEVLGRTEADLGRVVVGEVFEAYSTGTPVGADDVRPGDRARVSAGKLRLTVVPLVDGVRANLAEAAVQELLEALGRTDRFQVGLGDAVAVALAAQGVMPRQALDGTGLASIAERYHLENVLLVHLSRVQNRPYMDIGLFTFPAGARLLSTALFVPASVRPAPRRGFSASGQSRETPAPRSRSLLARLLGGDIEAGAYSSAEGSIPLVEVARFPHLVLSMDAAVSPRDGVPRLALTDGVRTYLYRLVDQKLEPEWTYRGGTTGHVFLVQLADLDGDGVLDVVVNRYHPNPQIGLTSVVLTTRDGKPSVMVPETETILFAVDATGEGIKRVLWGQPFAQEGFFKRGHVDRFALRNGALAREGLASVPRAFRAIGATTSNIAGKGTRSLVFIDEHSRLRIGPLDGGDDTWRSTTPVGGHPFKLEVITQIEASGRSFLYPIEPTPVSVDLDGDGIEEIVVPQNQVPGRLGVVYRSPAGYRFQSVSSGFEGSVLALGSLPGESAATLILAVARFTGSFSLSGETQLIMTTSE